MFNGIPVELKGLVTLITKTYISDSDHHVDPYQSLSIGHSVQSLPKRSNTSAQTTTTITNKLPLASLSLVSLWSLSGLCVCLSLSGISLSLSGLSVSL